MSLITFRNKEWHLTVTRNMPLWAQCMDAAGQFLHSRKYGIETGKYHLSIIRDGTMASMFANQENLDSYVQDVENLCKRPKGLNFLKEQYYKFGNKLLAVGKKLKNNFSRKNYKNFYIAYTHLGAGLFLSSAIGRHFPKLLGQELKQKLSVIDEREIEKIISEITYPKEHTPLFQSQLALLEIGSLLQQKKLKPEEINRNKFLQKVFNQYYEEYSIIPMNFCEEQWSREEVLGQLEKMMEDDCKLRLIKLKQAYQASIKKADSLLNKMNDKSIIKLVGIIRTAGVLNEYRKNVFCRINLDYWPFFQMIAKKFNIADWRELWKLTPHEIEELYFDENQDILKLISQRKIAGLITVNNKYGYEVISGDELKEFLRLLNKTQKEEINAQSNDVIKGTIANQGIIRGAVKVIISRKDFYKFNRGDILVAPMTSVDFVPIMEQAAAFVTNEGGITSHAAIVGREMNKPCIIGTKIATKILKDGDLVEVDANQGIVKLIQSSRSKQ